MLALLARGLVVATTVPSQVRLAFGGGSFTPASPYPDGMSVMWFTTDDTTSSMARWRKPGFSNWTVSLPGTSAGYLKDHGFHHRAEMTPLISATSYEYQCGSNASGWSEVAVLKMASNDIDAPFSVSIFGDMGYLDSTQRPMIIATAGLQKDWSAVFTRERLEALKDAGEIDAVWHLGDIGYLDGAFCV